MRLSIFGYLFGYQFLAHYIVYSALYEELIVCSAIYPAASPYATFEEYLSEEFNFEKLNRNQTFIGM